MNMKAILVFVLALAMTSMAYAAAPQYWTVNISPVNLSTYSSSQNYEFRVNWTDEDTAYNSIVSVVLNFDGTNYSMSNATTGNSSWNYTLPPQAGGTHTYYVWARDVAGDSNWTGNLDYGINPASATCALAYVNVTYPADLMVNGSCTATGGIIRLFRNGTNVTTENATAVDLGVADYGYVVYLNSTTNYTSASDSQTATVSIGSPTCALSYVNVTWPTDLTVNGTCTGLGLGGVIRLYRNGTNVSSENATAVDLGVADFGYTVYLNSTVNYTAASSSQTASVSIGSASCTLTYTNVTWPTDLTVTGSCINSSGTVRLYRNETNVTSENGIAVDLGVADYAYLVYLNSTVNHTAVSNSSTAVVSISSATTCWLNYTNVTYPADLRVNGTCTGLGPGGGTVRLFRNETNVSSENATAVDLGVADYGYTVYLNSTVNYTSASSSQTAVVGIGSPTCALSYVNVTWPNDLMVNGTCTATGGIIRLFRNSTNVTTENATAVDLGVADFGYTVYLNSTVNYTSASDSQTATVTLGTPVCALTYTNVTWPTDLTMAGTCTGIGPAGGTVRLYRNETNVSSENATAVDLGAADYGYSVYLNSTVNYTAASSSQTAVVSKNTPTCALTYSNVTYPAQVTVNGTCGSTTGIVKLYRDGVNVTTTENATNITLAAGTYAYVVNSTATANYSVGSDSQLVVVTGVSATCSLSSVNVTWPTDLTVNGTCGATGGTITLFRNGTDVTALNGTAVDLGAGDYLFQIFLNASGNYSPYNTSQVATISVGAPVCALTYTNVTYPADLTVFGTCTGLAPGGGTVRLYRNGTNVSSENNTAVDLGAADYLYTVYVNSTANYTSASTSELAVVSQGAGSVKLLLNGYRGSIVIFNGSNVTMNASMLVGQGNIELWNSTGQLSNATNKTSNITYFYQLGIFNISAIFRGTVNLTEDSESWWVQVLNNTNTTVVVNENSTTISIPPGQNVATITIPTEVPATTPVVLDLGFMVSSGNVTTPSVNLTATRDGPVDSVLFIENGTILQSTSAWTGRLELPITISVAGYSPPADGTVDQILVVGWNQTINATQPMKVVLGGMAGKSAAYSERGSTTLIAISALCDGTHSNIDFTNVRECSTDSGSDLVIWTYHLTTFAAYTPTAEEESSSSSSSGSGGSSSVQDDTPKQKLSWGEIMSGREAAMLVDANGIPIKKITFKAKKKMQNVELTVKALKAKPATTLAAQNAYQYLELIGANTGDAEYFLVDFDVNRTWLVNTNLAVGEVVLYRWVNNAWVALPTTITGSTQNLVKFQSKSPGLSFFAIGGQNAAPITPPPVVQPPTPPTTPPAEEPEAEPPADEPETGGDEPTDEVKGAGKLSVWWAVLIIAIVGVVVMVFVTRKKKK
ncbi:MAG: PGF-pre-PGF domain-containing protein [Nanoarchaeota archaeon]